MRNKNRYNIDLEANHRKETGIKNPSTFIAINKFHPYENLIADVMHDILEGVADFVLTNVIDAFMKEKLFDLHTLNSRMNNFPYSESEKRNKSRPLCHGSEKIINYA